MNDTPVADLVFSDKHWWVTCGKCLVEFHGQRKEVEAAFEAHEEGVHNRTQNLINAEVLAVLTRVGGQAKVTNYRASNGEVMKEYDIPLSVITQEKQRYGGKEQEK